MDKKYRIKSKFRFTLFLIILFLIVFTSVNGLLGYNNVNGSSMNEYYVIKISDGDTLWNIATEYGPDNQDIRDTVYEICELNEMQASDLEAGQKILIPVYE